MPSLLGILRRFTDTKAVYWEKSGPGDDGQMTYLTPSEPDLRWEDKQQEIVLDDGRRVISSGYLILSVPLKVGSLIWLGSLADWEATSFYPSIPTVAQGGREILKVCRTPGIKQLPGNVYEVYL